ncbi:MAG: FIG00949969: hypothetical protein [uncultured Pyrinomonadaceae bacterium]|uniref:DUF2254 domain-containing protein n=1 Tax=uncultured Pyrinomonadaceae bacterium TaxID=2283094 RepID=A0A6J4NPF4_9BACT|nr:MAG: FIG00949969: hypothetical protein [uncultured Pyrinomonadaceae bacterium]
MNKLKQFLSDLRASLWFVPGVMIAFSIALAVGLIEIDSRVQPEWFDNFPRLFGLGADGSRGMLTAIASSMLTVAALAFTLTLSAVTQASGQFTPRIFRNFMRDRANQFVLGYFVSVFAFCLIVLRTIRGGDELKFVPSLAVMVGLALALGGILVLIFFIHHIADSLQITTILDNITLETKKSIERLFPEKLGEAASGDEKHEAWRAESVKNWTKIPAPVSGYVQSVDADGLLEYAAENNLLIRMRRGIGQFAGSGATLAEIAPSSESDRKNVSRREKTENETIEKVAGFFTLDRHRTVEQDAGFGIRQIVDIALKALSPGVNDTTTAVECIDNLGEIVGEIARRRLPARVRSKDNVPRVLTFAPEFGDYVETAFDQIRASGKANQAIFERLLTTIQFVAERTSDKTRRNALRRQVELIGEYTEQTLETDYEKEKVRLKINEAKKFLSE